MDVRLSINDLKHPLSLLNLLFLKIRHIFSYFFKPAVDDDLKKTFTNALRTVKSSLIFGSSNKAENYIKTNGWVTNLLYRFNVIGQYVKITNPSECHPNDYFANGNYFDDSSKWQNQKWIYQASDYSRGYLPSGCYILAYDKSLDPLHDKQFNLSPQQQLFLMRCMLTKLRRSGNCKDKCYLIIEYLWRHSQNIHRIEYVITLTFDHAMIIVNRSSNENSRLNSSETWGANCWVIDAWYGDEGIFFPASEFKTYIKKIKQFAIYQKTQMEKLHISTYPIDENKEEVLNKCSLEILPQKHHYPTYSANPIKPISDYYEVIAPGEFGIFATREKNFIEHKNKMKPCLDGVLSRRPAPTR